MSCPFWAGEAGAAQLWLWLAWGRARLTSTLLLLPLLFSTPDRGTGSGPTLLVPSGGPDGGQVGQAVQMGTRRDKHPPTPPAPSALTPAPAGAVGPEPHSSPTAPIFLSFKLNFKAKTRAWRPAAPGAGRGRCTVPPQSLVTPVARSASGCRSRGAGAGSSSIPCPGRDARPHQRLTGDQLNSVWVMWGHAISPMDALEGRPRRNPSEPPSTRSPARRRRPRRPNIELIH